MTNTATCHIYQGGIIHLDDVGGVYCVKKKNDTDGNEVDTLSYSDKDEIALDYRKIQDTFHTDFYNIYPIAGNLQ